MAVNNYDSMNMIGHNHKRIQFGLQKMVWNFMPYKFNRLSYLIQSYFTINKIPEQAFFVIGTNG
jgi:hypothetical protein